MAVQSSHGALEDDVRALDELFTLTSHYGTTQDYRNLLKFVARFRAYSPFNAMLIHVQMPGAVFVAPPSRWQYEWQHRVRAGARPLVILQPKGPVMFVFDVSDVEPCDGAQALPRGIVSPFEVRGQKIPPKRLERIIENAKRDGIHISPFDAGSQGAGQIAASKTDGFLEFTTAISPKLTCVMVPIRYELLLNRRHPPETQFATLAHELAHLYCGHLGTPDPNWWPNRAGLDRDLCEFEAESASFLVCRRAGIDTPSEEYLSWFLKEDRKMPPISLNAVMTAAGLIERMAHERLKPRKSPGA